MSTTQPKRQTGLAERHAKACRSRTAGARCSCTPAWQASVWDNRTQKRLTKTFATKTAATLDRLEATRLDAAPFGIGHIAVGCALSYLDFRFETLGWRDGRAGLAAWHAGFCARPSVQASQVVDA